MKSSALHVVVAIAATFFATSSPAQFGGLFESTEDKMARMPADMAWEELQSQIEGGKTLNVLLKKTKEAEGIDFSERARLAEEKAIEASQGAETPAKALDEIVSDVSEYLVTDLPNHSEVSGSNWRLTLALGRLIDRSDDGRLETALDEIAFHLMRNDQFAKHFKVLSSTKSEADAILTELSGKHPDDIYDPTTTSETGSKTVHPEDLFLLTGETSVWSEENNRKLVTRTMIRVEHPASREIVLAEMFKKTYYFHPSDMKFISEEENEHRRETFNSKKSGKKKKKGLW